MKSPSILTIKKLYAMSGNICAMPGCGEKLFTSSGDFIAELCHINAKNEFGPRFDPNQSEEERNSFDNLIILCPKCHKIIDANTDAYSSECLREIKKIHENYCGRNENDDDLIMAQNIIKTLFSTTINDSSYIAINSPNANQNITFKISSKNKPSFNPPANSIGNNRLMSAYIEHLIDRYNRLASKNKSRKTSFNFGAISKNIQDRFGTRWKALNIKDFDALMEYLYGRIDKTIIGKINKSRGIKNYSSLEDWAEKHPNLRDVNGDESIS